MSMSAHDTPGTTAEHLRADLEHARDQLRRLEDEYAGMLADPGTLQEDRDNARTMLEAARRTFTDAESALAQLESGTYGLCTVCGGPIGAERLEALPGATMCVTCQSRS
jgi:RNA polymerase-binding transcription factor DksA